MQVIKIKKGLDIHLVGDADRTIEPIKTQWCAVKPPDFIGVFPKLHVAEGDKVKAGTVLFHDKYHENLLFTSPISGTVEAIRRGEKRVLNEIVIKSDNQDDFVNFGEADPQKLTRYELIDKMLLGGIWNMIRQRPYSTIANPADNPKAIFVSAFDSSPLAPDYNLIIENEADTFQTGINVLSKLTTGKVHLNVKFGRTSEVFLKTKNAQINHFSGAHPAGNVGTQINKIDPINKGDIVWYCNPQEVITIGRLFKSGRYDSRRIFAVTGSEILKPHYYQAVIGTKIDKFIENNVSDKEKRFISGNVLTGTKIEADGFLGFYANQLTVIPEGNHHEFMGWLAPGFKKFSFSHSFLSYLFPKKRYTIDTNLNGGQRAFVVTGEFEKIFPFDIYPMQLIKSCIIKDIDQMEQLGIYEVDEEDFALCEVIDTSKIPIQKIIREGLDYMRTEMC